MEQTEAPMQFEGPRSDWLFDLQDGPTVCKRWGRKRAPGPWAPRAIAQGPTLRQSLAFVTDSLSDGRRLRVLCVIDDCSRKCLATVVDTSLAGHRVAPRVGPDRLE